jgi:acetoin:2,6-dichlorophenolindophenol oxidoreductase subunit beta
MRELRYLHAVQEGIRQEMLENGKIVILGEDIRHSLRGITKGFFEEFGEERVIDTPLSEIALVGMGTGLALSGVRPIIEFQLSEFVFLAFDQMVNQAQKFKYMSGGKFNVPVTYIVPSMGARGGSMAGQHSDITYSYVLQAGMKVAVPSNAYDAKGLVISAIREDDPVMVYLPAKCLAKKDNVPEEIYAIPFGKGVIKKQGKDITIIAIGHYVQMAVEVAEIMDSKGISLEVVDPRTLLPLDTELIKQSVSKTGKVIIMDDSNKTCGFASEIAAFIGEELFGYLKAPIRRIARTVVPVPFSTTMESFVIPDKQELMDVINEFNIN